MKGMNCK